MGDSRKSDLTSEVIINYMLIVMVAVFISFVIFMILVRKFCPPNLGDDEPPRIKK